MTCDPPTTLTTFAGRIPKCLKFAPFYFFPTWVAWETLVPLWTPTSSL